MCLARTMNDEEAALRKYFGQRGEEKRLNFIKSEIKDAIEKAGLLDKYNQIHENLDFCRKTRNNFAHCHRADDLSAGIFYVTLEDSAKSEVGRFTFTAHQYYHVDAPLLEKIEAYFWMTMQRLQWLESEIRLYSKNTVQWPNDLSPPKLHNPPEKHIPPWQDEQKNDYKVAE